MLFKSFNPAKQAGATPLTGPELTYTTGILTRIDYAGGEFKVFDYNADGTLNTIALTIDGTTTTKTLNYTDSVLTSVTEV